MVNNFFLTYCKQSVFQTPTNRLSSCSQTDLENVNFVLNDAECKSIKAAKDFAVTESQLQDMQVYRHTLAGIWSHISTSLSGSFQ